MLNIKEIENGEKKKRKGNNIHSNNAAVYNHKINVREGYERKPQVCSGPDLVFLLLTYFSLSVGGDKTSAQSSTRRGGHNR